MATNTSISTASLDFTDNRAALKAFLKTQSEFLDYDFEGSNMGVLLDLLSYNTYMNAFYLNMTNAERFLDSAQLRDSAVSRAKELNYIPRSNRSPVARVTASVPLPGIEVLTVPRGTVFSGYNANGTYQFVTRGATTWRSSTNTFAVANLSIYEGSYISESYVVDRREENQRFRVSTANADTDSLLVTVAYAGANATQWPRASTLYGLSPDSNVYFIQGAEGGTHEVVFGDDVLGRNPIDGSVVTLEYMVTYGPEADGVETFTLETDLGVINGGTVGTPLTVTTVAKSEGGAEPEPLADIRRKAPRHFQTQERAVTTADYADIILETFPDVVDAYVYGGETITGSVEYGRVFVALVDGKGVNLTDARKLEIKLYLEARAIMGMEVLTIDPEYLYVNPTVTIHVDPSLRTLSDAQLEGVVTSAIDDYREDHLQRFNVNFRMTRMAQYVTEAETSIVSTEITTTISKTVAPNINAEEAFSVELHNAIKSGIRSSEFLSLGKRYVLTDTITDIDPDGTMYLLEINPAYTSPVYATAGAVNYDMGTIDIAKMVVSGYAETDGIKFTATTVSQDVKGKKNDVLDVDSGAGMTVIITES